MLSAIALTAFTVLLTAWCHYEGLRAISLWVDKAKHPPRHLILYSMLAVILLHMIEITFFAVAFYLGDRHFMFGDVMGHTDETWLDYFYIAAETYTTLGAGVVYPVGYLRILAIVEPICGLLMITWSGSFTYLLMTKLWERHGLKRK